MIIGKELGKDKITTWECQEAKREISSLNHKISVRERRLCGQHLGSSSDLRVSTIGRERVNVPFLASRPSSLFFFFQICFRMAGPYRKQACGLAGRAQGVVQGSGPVARGGRGGRLSARLN